MDDLVSRQAAIDAMNTRLEDIKLTWRGKVKKGEIAMYLDMRGVIETLPSAQPERMKGAWINEGRIIRCNKCKIGYAAVKGMKSALTYNFCPNCGVDMRGEQDG